MKTVQELNDLDMLAQLAEHWEGRELLDVVDKVVRYVQDGRTVGIYENADLSHPHCGDIRLMASESETPPERLPDTPTEINWRYRLKAVYRGSK